MTSNVRIIRLIVGEMNTNCYVLSCAETGVQAVVDPGGDLEAISSSLTAPECILLTHCHFDHIGSVEALKERFEIPCYCHEREPCDLCNRRLQDGDIVTFGKISLDVLHTPGHTEGGVSYRLGNVLFCGDTIFLGAMGATHYPGGDFDTLIRTITQKIFRLPEEIILLPGHGPRTTVGREKASGFYPMP